MLHIGYVSKYESWSSYAIWAMFTNLCYLMITIISSQQTSSMRVSVSVTYRIPLYSQRIVNIAQPIQHSGQLQLLKVICYLVRYIYICICGYNILCLITIVRVLIVKKKISNETFEKMLDFQSLECGIVVASYIAIIILYVSTYY